MNTNEPVLPLILFLIWPQRERMGPIFERLEARGFEVLVHCMEKGVDSSSLAALYDTRDLRLLVYPKNVSYASMYGAVDMCDSFVSSVEARGIPVIRFSMHLGGPFDDEVEVTGKPDIVVAQMLQAMGIQ